METTYDLALEQIVQSVFSTMLNIDFVRIDKPLPEESDQLVVAIHIAGKWTGSVVLGLSPEMARAAAAGLLATTPDNVTEEDLRDVAAELVNMIGGNLKGFLPGPSFLSLPTIVRGRECGMEVCDSRLADTLVMGCEFGLLTIRLYESDSRRDESIV